MTTIRIGTRGSALALWQSRHIASRLAAARPEIAIELVEITSTGDQITDVPLSEVEGTGFFTSTIERALAAGEVDVAVHSFKDLPVVHTPALAVAAVPERGPIEDVLCARDGLTLATLPRGARVGTCSTRRTAQVRARRPDLDIRPLRGNVPTRLERVTRGDLDAVVLARAGVIRLGMDSRITEIFPIDEIIPAPAQGALAIQCRAADVDLLRLLSSLDDRATREAVEAERTVLHALGGGCSVPVGASATVTDGARSRGVGRIRLLAGVFALDEPTALRITMDGDNPRELGLAAAARLLELGAGAIVSGVRS